MKVKARELALNTRVEVNGHHTPSEYELIKRLEQSGLQIGLFELGHVELKLLSFLCNGSFRPQVVFELEEAINASSKVFVTNSVDAAQKLYQCGKLVIVVGGSEREVSPARDQKFPVIVLNRMQPSRDGQQQFYKVLLRILRMVGS